MENSLVFDIPLVTKFWDFDYGTFSALPYNCKIKKIIKDEDGEFTIFCTKMKMRYSDEICIEVLNPSFEFDYILTTIGKTSFFCYL
uniref:Uncharacterized protein n=1 Tax=Panagrolaimus sp. PS1159 TaxID=55785 RepID=A0AC35EWW9_9BILA